jgi:hypothetical protein
MDREMGVELGGSGMDRPGELLSLTELVLEMVGKLSPEVRMLALGLKEKPLRNPRRSDHRAASGARHGRA